MPKAKAQQNVVQFPSLEPEEVNALVRTILPLDEDEPASALIALVMRIAYEEDKVTRDILACAVADQASAQTSVFSELVKDFTDEAMSNAKVIWPRFFNSNQPHN